jgi:glutamine synthetase
VSNTALLPSPTISTSESKEPERVFSNAEEVLKYISDEKVEYVDIRFCDLPGVMQHLTVPAKTAGDLLENGAAFDGSSVRGFQAINESDMALHADPTTARVDPFRKHKHAEHQLLRARPDHRRALLP